MATLVSQLNCEPAQHESIATVSEHAMQPAELHSTRLNAEGRS
jgi:hypothetical protein